MKKTVGMLGGGAWGTAVATLLAHNGYTVHLWCYEPEIVKNIVRSRKNMHYLPDVRLSSLIKPTNSMAELFKHANVIFEAVPVAHMRYVFFAAKQYINDQHGFVVLSKGIEQGSLLLPSQIIQDVLGARAPIAAVVGPSYAKELALQCVTSFEVATLDHNFGLLIAGMLNNEYCCTLHHEDLIGAQCGGAFKNVLSLGLGILDGAHCADNAQAFVFTRGLYEMSLLAEALGGKKETLYGLSGLGDLVLTARGSLSRNTYLGRWLGRGKKLEKILEKLGTVPEGVNTIKSVTNLIERFKIQLPVFEGIDKMVNDQLPVARFLNSLMQSCQQ